MLDAGRPTMQGAVRPIPLSEIMAYMEMFKIVGVEERTTLVMMIRSLDSIYVEHMNAAIRREIDANRLDRENGRER